MKFVNITVVALLSFTLFLAHAKERIVPEPSISNPMVSDFFKGMQKSCRQSITQKNQNPDDISRGYKFCDCLSEQAQQSLLPEDDQKIMDLLTTKTEPQVIEDYITTLVKSHMTACGNGEFYFVNPE